VISKSDDGLLYKLRHCSSGKEPRAPVHANRLKLFRDDRDLFFIRHNITPKDVTQTATSVTQPVISPPIATSATTADDTWYLIESLLQHKKSVKRSIIL